MILLFVGGGLELPNFDNDSADLVSMAEGKLQFWQAFARQRDKENNTNMDTHICAQDLAQRLLGKVHATAAHHNGNR